MDFKKQFDVLWSVESISHYQRLEDFFVSAGRLLKPGGAFAIIDWFPEGKSHQRRNQEIYPAHRKRHAL